MGVETVLDSIFHHTCNKMDLDITCKVFLRKTKRGKVLKVVREHYLRDDLWCGSSICRECGEENAASLESTPVSSSTLCDFPHYIVIDTNVVLHQIDVLESPVWKNVILLQTVMEEARKRSSTNFKKLKDIMAERADNFYVFVNEHHKNTYVERKPGESANDRNDRAIRVACQWYQKHLDSSQNKSVKIVLLTEDAKNREIAISEGLHAYRGIIISMVLTIFNYSISLMLTYQSGRIREKSERVSRTAR